MAIYEIGAPPSRPSDADMCTLLDELREATGEDGWHIGHTVEADYRWRWPWKLSEVHFWRVLRQAGDKKCQVLLCTSSRQRAEGYLAGLIDAASHAAGPWQPGQPESHGLWLVEIDRGDHSEVLVTRAASAEDLSQRSDILRHAEVRS